MANIQDIRNQIDTNELNSTIESIPSQIRVSMTLKLFWYFSFIFIVPIIIHFVLANKIKKMQKDVNFAASSIDTQLNLKSNILLKMFELIKGYVEHEKNIYEKITSIKNYLAKEKIENFKAREEISQINRLTFESLLEVREHYPELKSNEKLLELMQQTTNVEREIISERNNYNMYVTIFNEKMISFPINIVASSSELWTIPLFQGNETDRRDISLKQ